MEAIKKTMPPFIKGLLCALASFCAYMFIGSIVFMLTGCALKQEPIYIEKPVPYAVPTKCDIALPARPIKDISTVANVKGILIYTEQVEDVAIACGATREP